MKSAQNEYKKPSFFYTEVFENAPRTIAWDGSANNQKKIFFTLLDQMGERINYLFKEDMEEEKEEDRWCRISGGIYKASLRDLIDLNEEWFFNDSIFQFCFKEADNDDYVAYDEHGLFFIYGIKDCDSLLIGLGLENRVDDLICDKPHWHARPKDSEKILRLFKETLKNDSVFYEDQADQDSKD